MISIRQATIEDWEKLRELNQKIFVNNSSFDEDLIVDFAMTPEGESFFKDAITRQDGCCLIAEEDGRMVGYTNGGTKDISYRKSKYFEIDNLGVTSEMKGKGLGLVDFEFYPMHDHQWTENLVDKIEEKRNKT